MIASFRPCAECGLEVLAKVGTPGDEVRCADREGCLNRQAAGRTVDEFVDRYRAPIAAAIAYERDLSAIPYPAEALADSALREIYRLIKAP